MQQQMLLVSAESMNKLQKQLQLTVKSRLNECTLMMEEIATDIELVHKIDSAYQTIRGTKIKMEKSLFQGLNPFAREVN
jgi:hypothetical protein